MLDLHRRYKEVQLALEHASPSHFEVASGIITALLSKPGNGRWHNTANWTRGCLDCISFSVSTLFCSRLPSRIPHIYSSRLLSLLQSLAISLSSLALTLLKGTWQLFYKKISVLLVWHALTISLGPEVLGIQGTGMKGPSHPSYWDAWW